MAIVIVKMHRKNADGTYDDVYPVASSCTGNAATATTATTCTGNSATSTILANTRTIAISGGATGTATGFNGSSNISIPITSLDATKLVGVATINTSGNSATSSSCTGNAATSSACSGNAVTSSTCTGNSVTAGTATYTHYSSHAIASSGSAVRNTTQQAGDPSGGSDGDIWHTYS